MDCARTHTHIHTLISRHCMASILEAGRTAQDKTQNTTAGPLLLHVSFTKYQKIAPLCLLAVGHDDRRVVQSMEER